MSMRLFIKNCEKIIDQISPQPKMIPLTKRLPGNLATYREFVQYWHIYAIAITDRMKKMKDGDLVHEDDSSS